MKIGRNDKCYCGNNLKYKKCCFKKALNNRKINHCSMSKEEKEYYDNFSNLPFRAEIISENGNASSMTISSAVLTKNGITTNLFEDEITLSVNKPDGDSLNKSSATLTVPHNEKTKSEIITAGNADVKNSKNYYQIQPLTKKNLKIISPQRNKARIKIDKQIDNDFEYFDILFLTGRTHPHIAFYPDGNGKFIGLRGFDCDLKSVLNYNPSTKIISPSTIEIEVKNINEKLRMDFSFNNENNSVTLTKCNFIEI